MAFIANKAVAEKVCGRRLPGELFQLDLWGRRVLICREPSERRYGSIILPTNDQYEKSAGWILACGELVGLPEPGAPGWSPYNPDMLLLKKVFFRKWAGEGIPVLEDPDDKTDEELDEEVQSGRASGDSDDNESTFVLMTDLDILATIEERGSEEG